MKSSILKQITELSELSFDNLKEKWKVLYSTDPPEYNRNFLIKRLAYRIQEIHFGGLSELARHKMKIILQENGFNESGMPDKSVNKKHKKEIPVIGTRLIREYKGIRYEVTIINDGFEFEGRKYHSLSAIARAITGTRWNGPAFFGLRNTRGDHDDKR